MKKIISVLISMLFMACISRAQIVAPPFDSVPHNFKFPVTFLAPVNIFSTVTSNLVVDTLVYSNFTFNSLTLSSNLTANGSSVFNGPSTVISNLTIATPLSTLQVLGSSLFYSGPTNQQFIQFIVGDTTNTVTNITVAITGSNLAVYGSITLNSPYATNGISTNILRISSASSISTNGSTNVAAVVWGDLTFNGAIIASNTSDFYENVAVRGSNKAFTVYGAYETLTVTNTVGGTNAAVHSYTTNFTYSYNTSTNVSCTTTNYGDPAICFTNISATSYTITNIVDNVSTNVAGGTNSATVVQGKFGNGTNVIIQTDQSGVQVSSFVDLGRADIKGGANVGGTLDVAGAFSASNSVWCKTLTAASSITTLDGTFNSLISSWLAVSGGISCSDLNATNSLSANSVYAKTIICGSEWTSNLNATANINANSLTTDGNVTLNTQEGNYGTSVAALKIRGGHGSFVSWDYSNDKSGCMSAIVTNANSITTYGWSGRLIQKDEVPVGYRKVVFANLRGTQVSIPPDTGTPTAYIKIFRDQGTVVWDSGADLLNWPEGTEIYELNNLPWGTLVIH